MTITVKPYTPGTVGDDALASLIVYSLTRSVNTIITAADEGVDAPKGARGHWPEAARSCSCNYALRIVQQLLDGLVGEQFEDVGVFNYRVYHATELLKLIRNSTPKSAKQARFLLECAIREAETLTDLLEVA